MFSGIVKDIGIIKKLESKDEILELTISSNKFNDLQIGDSIAVDGCCLTITEIGSFFKVQVTQETIDKTYFSKLKVDTKVNLEPSLKIGDKLDGHLVSGHVDSCGKVLNIFGTGENRVVETSLPKDLKKYLAKKGSICVNGVCLTVVDVRDNSFTFSLIPFTRDNTNLGLIKVGDLVNLEIDMISRYLVNYLQHERELAHANWAKGKKFKRADI